MNSNFRPYPCYNTELYPIVTMLQILVWTRVRGAQSQYFIVLLFLAYTMIQFLWWVLYNVISSLSLYIYTEVSRTCAALSNISQYVNVIISNITAQPTDCTFNSESCDGIECYIGNAKSFLSFSLSPCDVPPIIKGVAKSPNGTVMFNQTLRDNQLLYWKVLSASLQLNVTLLHYNSSTIGLEVCMCNL